VLVATYETEEEAWDIYVRGEFAYLTVRVEPVGLAVQVLDVSDPTSPKQVGEFDSDFYWLPVDAAGNRAVIAAGNSGVQLFDLASPSEPVFLAEYPMSSGASDTWIAHGYAFLTSWHAGLHVIDVHDPSNPALVARCDTPGVAHKLFVSWPYAYVADQPSAVRIIDVGDPTNPTLVGGFDGGYEAPGKVEDIWVSGDYALVAAYTSGLQIIDVKVKQSPVPVGSVGEEKNWAPVCVAAFSHYAYVGDESAGAVHVVDFADPANPVVLTTLLKDDAGMIYDIAVDGETAYVSYLSHPYPRLVSLDLGDPAVPVPLASIELDSSWSEVESYPREIHAAAGKVFLAWDYPAAMLLTDFEDPANPFFIAAYQEPWHGSSVFASAGYAYFTATDRLHIYDVSGCW